MKQKVKCRYKIVGKCDVTGKGCDHAILHKETSFCNFPTCGGCIVPPKKKSVIEDIVVDLKNYIDSCNGPYILVSVEDLKSWVSMLL